MDEMINYLKEKSLYFDKLSSDKDFLYTELNNLSNDRVEFLINNYQDKIGPLNILRLVVLKEIKQNIKINDDIVQEIKDNFNSKNSTYFEKYLDESATSYINNYISPKGGNPFLACREPFSIFYVFFYNGECKEKVYKYYNEMSKQLISELNLEGYTFDITAFEGPRNQGQSNTWVNIFPKELKNYNNAIGLYFETKNGKFYSGLSKSYKNQIDIEIPKEFQGRECFSFMEALEHLRKAKNFAIEANESLLKLNNQLNIENIDNQEMKNRVRYWVMSAGEKARVWEDFKQNSIIAIGWDYENLGNLSNYSNKQEIKEKLMEYNPASSNKNNTLALWQFSNEMQVGDIVFIKNTQTEILARGIVKSNYIYDEERNEYKHTRKVEWTNIETKESVTRWPVKTLTDITPYTEDVEKLENLYDIETQEQAQTFDKYTKEDFLNDVFMDENQYNTLKNLLLNKKNIILQGAPGVGKTFSAKRLCYSILGEKDTNKVKMIQFHQSYGYEDFIMGYRPCPNGFELKQGPFYDFCKIAQDDSDNKYFFIIDEINRGKLSKIFGELLMLIEPDKRGQTLRLLYKDEEFSVPKNLYIIGMMNTADRSIAMIDYALRRRFAFYEFKPAFDTDSFRRYKEKFNNEKYNALINVISNLNKEITDDCSLGSGFQIGHSYFCNNKEINDEWLNCVVEYEIIPLLKEYWFDEQSRVVTWSEKLKSAIR